MPPKYASLMIWLQLQKSGRSASVPRALCRAGRSLLLCVSHAGWCMHEVPSWGWHLWQYRSSVEKAWITTREKWLLCHYDPSPYFCVVGTRAVGFSLQLCTVLGCTLWLQLWPALPMNPCGQILGVKGSVWSGMHILYFIYISGSAKHLYILCTAAVNTAKKRHRKLGWMSQLRQFQNKGNSAGLMLQSSLFDFCGKPAEARSSGSADYPSLGFDCFVKTQINWREQTGMASHSKGREWKAYLSPNCLAICL